MKNRILVTAILLCGALAFAQQPTAPAQTGAPKAAQPAPTVTSVLDRQISSVEREIVPAADAMPEGKYNFAPTQGEFKTVRTFAEQVRHVATTNYVLAAAILGEKSPVPDGENDNGDPKYKSKAEIVQYLKDSFAYIHKAYGTINEKNLVEPIKNPFGPGTATRLGIAVLNQGHNFDHYGQMVEYLRMNGIIPPASRK
jgi:hypothetical protein